MITEERKKQRNQLVKRFFNKLGYDDVKIIGNKDRPAVILNKNMRLSLYINNFDIIFTSKVYGGDQMFMYRIGNSNKVKLEDQELDLFLKWIATAEHGVVYTIRVPGTDLRLYKHFSTGFNDTDTDRFPVFCETQYSIFISEDKAEEICEELSTERTPLEVYQEPFKK